MFLLGYVVQHFDLKKQKSIYGMFTEASIAIKGSYSATLTNLIEPFREKKTNYDFGKFFKLPALSSLHNNWT